MYKHCERPCHREIFDATLGQSQTLHAWLRASLAYYVAGILLDQPVRLEWFRATSRVESAGDGVVRFNIDANAPCSLFYEPRADLPHQHRPNSAALTLVVDIDPLQLAVASETARPVPSHETYQRAPVLRD
jgi:hypothetical protein